MYSLSKSVISGEIFLIFSIICGCLNDVLSKYLGGSASCSEIVFFSIFDRISCSNAIYGEK